MIPFGDQNPTRHFPITTILLIAANIAVFLLQISAGPAFEASIYGYGFVPANVFSPENTIFPSEIAPPYTILSAMFMHAGWLHLGSNMLFLWVFGDNVEDSMGPIKFLIFYLLCGLAAAFGQAFLDLNSVIPMIGASGAVSGVLGAYLILHPRAPVHAFIPPFFFIPLRIPAFIVLTAWFAFQLASDVMADAAEGGVAFRAHVAGFVTGAILVLLFRNKVLDRYGGRPSGPWSRPR